MKEELKIKFDEYVNQYDLNEQAIQRKYYHSYRVMDLCENIGNHLKLNEKDMEIVTISGLLHDYARFYQWTNYKTFKDVDSIDHGDKAVELLFENKEIEKYCEIKEYYDEIYDAIKNHNKISIQDDISSHNRLICQILRDADKLDIFYLLGINKHLLIEDEGIISEEIRNKFYNKEQISHKEIKNNNERILLYLTMFFDINFDYSYKYLLDYKLIDKMFENINNKELFKESFDFVKNEIKERLENYVREEI